MKKKNLFQAIARGVPILMIPFFGDQHRNALRSVRAGYAKMLKFSDISSQHLVDTVNDMMTNYSFSNRAKEISSIYKDNLVHPMDEAMFWIEYVARHSGASHLKSTAVHMHWFSYLLLDVLLVNLAICIFVVVLLCLAFRKCCRNKRKISSGKKQKLK